MPFESKTWTDRKTEYPNRRLLTKEDGSTELVTVSREEGIISEEGDPFSAENMNDLENRASTAFEEVESRFNDLIMVDNGVKNVKFADGVGVYTLVTSNLGTTPKYSQLRGVLVNGFGTAHHFSASITDANPYNLALHIECLSDETLTGEYPVSMIFFMKKYGT